MEKPNITTASVSGSMLEDLLPVGVLLSVGRMITQTNSLFANMFGYEPEDLLGKSLEILYPSHHEFIDRGDRWGEFMQRRGEHCDERIMLGSAEQPLMVRVKGRCKDPKNPYLMVACTFEITRPEPSPSLKLSNREHAIVEWMSAGLTSKEIARKLQLSHRTIETYRNRLMAKTGARNANHLLALLR